MSLRRLLGFLNRPLPVPRFWLEAVVIAAFCLGLFLRLGPFIHRDLWLDELFSVRYAAKDYDIIYQILHPLDDRPPLFYLFLRAQLFFSSNRYFLRLPSLISSLSVIVMFYLMLRKENKVAAGVTAFAAALSPFLIHYSWQVRDYGPMLFITVAIMWLYITQLNKVMRGEVVRWREVLGLTLLTFLGSLLNYSYFVYSMIFIGILATFGLWYFRSQRATFIDYATKVVLLRIPVFSIVIQYLLIQSHVIEHTTSWIPHVSWAGLGALIATTSGLGFAFDAVYPTDRFQYAPQLTLLAVIFPIALSLYVKNRRSFSPVTNFFVWVPFFVFFLNVLAMIVLGFVTDTSLFLANTFVSSSVLLVFSFGVIFSQLVVAVWRNIGIMMFCGVTIVPLIFSYYINGYLERYPLLYGDDRLANYQSYSEAMEIIKEELTPMTQFVALPYTTVPLIMEYYFPNQVGEMDRLAGYLETRVINPDVPVTHVRPYVRMNKIVIFSYKSMHHALQSGDGTGVIDFERNKKYRDYVSQICGGSIHVIGETSNHIIETCSVYLRSGQ